MHFSQKPREQKCILESKRKVSAPSCLWDRDKVVFAAVWTSELLKLKTPWVVSETMHFSWFSFQVNPILTVAQKTSRRELVLLTSLASTDSTRFYKCLFRKLPSKVFWDDLEGLAIEIFIICLTRIYFSLIQNSNKIKKKHFPLLQ